jgi:hypothetical protein
MYVCIYLYVYMHIYIGIYLNLYIYIHVNICIYIYICIYNSECADSHGMVLQMVMMYDRVAYIHVYIPICS